MDGKKAEIEFPHLWEYRVFSSAAGIDEVEKNIRRAVEEMKLSGMELERGAVSGNGSYRALRLAVTVGSKDEANALGERIRKLDGVRFIL
ncbi:MAG: DUF493 family protein [Lentisphaeria bacterium]|nr:DUF493 family protein [Lentisphaeria bacterium]